MYDRVELEILLRNARENVEILERLIEELPTDHEHERYFATRPYSQCVMAWEAAAAAYEGRQPMPEWMLIPSLTKPRWDEPPARNPRWEEWPEQARLPPSRDAL